MDAATPKGWTPIHIAAIRGHDPCAQVEFPWNISLDIKMIALGFD